jgi:hypothetical protein
MVHMHPCPQQSRQTHTYNNSLEELVSGPNKTTALMETSSNAANNTAPMQRHFATAYMCMKCATIYHSTWIQCPGLRRVHHAGTTITHGACAAHFPAGKTAMLDSAAGAVSLGDGLCVHIHCVWHVSAHKVPLSACSTSSAAGSPDNQKDINKFQEG